MEQLNYQLNDYFNLNFLSKKKNNNQKSRKHFYFILSNTKYV